MPTDSLDLIETKLVASEVPVHELSVRFHAVNEFYVKTLGFILGLFCGNGLYYELELNIVQEC